MGSRDGGSWYLQAKKVDGATKYSEKQRTFGTIEVYIQYCLFNDPNGASYVQSLISDQPKSSVC